MKAEMKYVEASGCCLNIDEKMRLDLAVKELEADYHLEKLWFWGKVTGK